MNRRSFFKLATAALAGGTLATACYGFFEAGWVEVTSQTVQVPRLPLAFDGLKVAFLTDIHHGPYVDLDYIRSIVRTTNLHNPDLILLGGDYSLRHEKYIAPCFEVLAELRAPLGTFGVMGNHDYWHGLKTTRRSMAEASITELTNSGVWFNRGPDRLRIAGVDDLWDGKPNLTAALDDARPSDCCLLVSHNPDFAETMPECAVKLVLSGHTHGGQVNLPGLAPRWAPTRYGAKYLAGFADAPNAMVYTSRGLGLTALPARFGCRPELTMLTLTV